jgi:N-methylhydantoinase B/oxoprolinase/acetone carboxylase alpha subunit
MTTYTRKTRDVYLIEQYTGPGYGWEEVSAEENRADAQRCRNEYRENQPEYPVRIRKTRERIDCI